MDRVIAVHGLRLCVYPVTSYIKGSNVVNPNVLKIRVLACFAVISIVARPSTNCTYEALKTLYTAPRLQFSSLAIAVAPTPSA